MYKVFIDSLQVYFIKKGVEIKNIFVENTNFYEVEKSNLMVTLTKISDFKSDNVDKVVFLCVDVKEVWEVFVQGYQLRVAAGGLVFNQKKEVLMIFRNDFWDLPKGHIELNESIEECAIREVEEECGILAPKVIDKIIITYHTYFYKGQKVLKENHWFKMTYIGDEKLVPQIEEGIT
jgi:8-oxo-dGTP pyrophosphatase MutT (NUDIX family)